MPVVQLKFWVFTPEQKIELIDYINHMESQTYGLTTQDILSLAYQLTEFNKISYPFSSQKAKADFDWLKGFRKRHLELSLPTSKSMSVVQA